MIQSAQGVSEWELALFFNDKLTQHCQYSADTAVGHATAYDAVTGDADGYGYALLYALVCREAGIDCGVVRGTVHTENSEGAHAWNVLTLDGVTGYTDVMWNDPANEDASWLPFHGYCFLSADEIGADHTPMTGICFPSDAETKNYYEQRGICIANADALGTMLAALMIDARANLSDCVEFMLDPTVELTDYALEEAIAAAIDAANADDIGNAPRLRQVHRLYRCTVSGGGITVQLFYEENNNEFGET